MSDRRPIHPPVRTHLDAISDATGIFQHALGAWPDPAHGYCTDDVARALQVDLLQAGRLGWAAVAASARRNLEFLEAAFDADAGRFRNFRAADGTWLDAPGSDDCQGRAIHALGDATAARHDRDHAARARTLFRAAVPAALRMTSPRASASVILGCSAVVGAGGAAWLEARYRKLALCLGEILELGVVEYGSAAWPWPEQRLTYENALLPRALIVAGADLGVIRLEQQGIAMLDWLSAIQVAPAGHLAPVGNCWWAADGPRGRFDQQPIEAASLLLAAGAALRVTGRPAYRETMERAYAWFLGTNDLGVSVAVAARGACHDGLTPTGVNGNQGAESTLMWLTAVERIAAIRAADLATVPDRDRLVVPLRLLPAPPA